VTYKVTKFKYFNDYIIYFDYIGLAAGSWELRLGEYRVLYDVAEEEQSVNVLVVGEKRGNQLHILGKEYTAHESD
jgi:mRNA-degrading endonuclease RelE of RelBE toxin-antitoxin system